MFAPFIQHLREQDRSETTVAGYVNDLHVFAGWFEAENGRPMEPGQVAPLDVRDYKRHLQEGRGYAPATVNRKLAALRTFFAWAVEVGTAGGDPTAGIRNVDEQPLSPRWLSRKEQRDLVRELELGVLGARTEPARWRALRDQAAVLLMLHAGLRVSEAARIKVEDLELNGRSGTLAVRGKRNKYRTISLNASARKALQAWLEARGDPGCAWLFVSQKGSRMRAKSLYERVVYYARRAGLEGITPHSLRHSCAKNLLDQDVPLNYVAATLGHTSLDTTARYTLPSQQDLARAMERIAWEEE